MKRILYRKNVFSILLLSIFIVSCSEDTMDRVNEYEANPNSVQLQFMLPDLLTSSAFTTTGGDFSSYASVYIEYEGGVFNQLYNAELRLGEPSSVSTYNNPWNGTYNNIMVAKQMITKATTGSEAGSKVLEGIARIMLAYNSAIMTDLFGDIPYTEAGILDEKGIPVYLQATVDKQADIYNDILKQLDDAILLIASKEQGPIGLSKNNDYIYNGDTDKWIKAANALKARYTMRLLNTTSNKEESLKAIIKYVDESFKSVNNEFKFALYDGANQVNPLAALTYSRAPFGASQSFVNKLKERNDPRLTQMFITPANSYEPISDPSELVLVPNGISGKDGVQQSQTYYSCNITDIASKAPTLMISYHEILFLKAEAHARLGQLSDAEAALKEAIAVGFANLARSVDGAVEAGDLGDYPENFDLSKEVSLKYYTDNIKQLFDKNPLKEIMIQKYLAMNGANGESIEIYSDIRRMQGANENFITLDNPLNAQGQFPYRYTYGSSDNASNPNIASLVGDGRYVYTEKVWWAGGTR